MTLLKSGLLILAAVVLSACAEKHDDAMMDDTSMEVAPEESMSKL